MCLVTIEDEFEIKAIAGLKRGMVEEPAHLAPTWLSENRWIVVPRLSASHFNDLDAGSLSEALIEKKYPLLFGLATEPLASFPTCFALATSKDGLLRFSEKCGLFNFVLVPADRSIAVLCTAYDYFLVAGPPQFVRHAVGGEIGAAWKHFEQEALDPCWEGRLKKVVERYRNMGSGSA